MEALPSSSVATAASPQLALAAMGRAGKDGNGLPVFAQIIHEALNRATNSSDAPPAAVPSKGSGAPIASDKAKKPRQLEKDEVPTRDTPDGTSAVNLALLPSVVLALQVPNLNQQSTIDAMPQGNIAAHNSGTEPGTTNAEPVTKNGLPQSAPGSGDPTSNENNTPPATASRVFAEEIQAQLPDVLSALLPIPAATAPVADAPPRTGSATPNSRASSDPAIDQLAGEAQPPANAPTFLEPELAPAVSDPLPSLPSQSPKLQQKNAGTQPSALTAGDPLSLLPSQGQQLRHADAHGQSSTSPASGAPTQAGSQFRPSAETQQVGKPALAPLPAFGAEPSALTDSGPMPRGLQTAIDGAQAAAPTHARAQVQVQGPSDSPPEPGGSKDASANHKEPARPDAVPPGNVSFPALATHDIAGSSQLLAAGSPAKQDGAPVPAAAATVVPGPPVATSDRGVVAAPHLNPPAASAPLPPPEGADVAASHFVSNAKLIEAAGHSEMRVAIETEKLGAVELRAHMVGDEVGAAITVEKRDAHAALAVELPALQQALSDKDLRIEHVTLSHGSFSSTTGDASNSTKQDERSGPQAASRPWPVDAGRLASMFGGGEPSGIFDSHGRLSVRA